MAEPFPWARAMQFAFGQLHLSPQAFWSMTMHELNQAMVAHCGSNAVPMARSSLEQLIKQHPDRQTDGHTD